MVLIYVQKTSARLQYVASFIFKEVFNVPYAITEQRQSFNESGSIKINYSGDNVTGNELRVPNRGLLFETGIKEQPLEVFEVDGVKAFFKSSSPEDDGFPFDIFSSTFYLICRYEEYLPHIKDKFGRYAPENSIAFQQRFLHLPLVNIWLNYFADHLKRKFPTFETVKSAFNFIPTYDVDIAYSYLHKGFLKNAIGSIKSILKCKFADLTNRLKVLKGNEKDPYDNFDWLNNLHNQYNLKPVFFFLVPDKNSLYDENILPHTKAMHDLIIDHANKYPVGLHPSWQSGDDFSLLEKEKQTLQKISGLQIKKSRQHYFRFNMPEGYRRLTIAGLTEDYSLGYGSINGFRASVASAFYWYDLEKETQSTLKIFPLCYMDSAAIFHLKLTATEAYDELMHYYTVCKQVQGTFITILHNHLTGSDNVVWRNMYERFLKKIAG